MKLQDLCNRILWEEAKQATVTWWTWEQGFTELTGTHWKAEQANLISYEAAEMGKDFYTLSSQGRARVHGKSEKVGEVYKLSKVTDTSSLEKVLSWRQTAINIIRMKGERL